MLCRVPQKDGPRIGADINKYMVALHIALANGWQPPRTMTEAEYKHIKFNNDQYPPELVAFAATGLTFGSVWFFDGGFARSEPDRCRQSADSCLRDVPGLKGAKFIHSSYDELEIPPQSLIYCDPPYLQTAGYGGSAQVIEIGDSGAKNIWRAYKFWQWADRMVEAGHTVFVSEYTGPDRSIYNSVYPPALKAELDAARAERRALNSAPASTPNKVFLDANDKITRIEERARLGAADLAARWKIVWQKEVSVNINAIGVDVEARKEMDRELVEVNAAILSSEVPDDKVVARAAELRKLIAAAQSKKETEKLFHRET